MEDFNCDKCSSSNLNFVKYKMENGIFILRKQCFNCGRILTLNYKRSYVKSFDKLPEADYQKRDELKALTIKKSEIKSILFRYANKHFKKSLDYYRNVYLKSSEWKHKRELIMDFYNWKCQRCNNDAIDLHHLTYDNIFKEKFEDLIPLCRSCHEKEHNKIETIKPPTSGLSLKLIKLKKINIIKKLNQ